MIVYLLCGTNVYQIGEQQEIAMPVVVQQICSKGSSADLDCWLDARNVRYTIEITIFYDS